MVWQILHDVDTSSAKGRESLMTRSPFLEMEALTEEEEGAPEGMDKRAVQGLETAEGLESPR